MLDNALVLPEYLVEFEYITNQKTDANKPLEADTINENINKLLGAINGA